MGKTGSLKKDKNKQIILFSVFAVAVLGLLAFLSLGSSSGMGSFLMTFAGSSKGTTSVKIDSYPSSMVLGKAVTLRGSGFTTDNRVHIGSKQVNNVKSYEGGTIIVFEMPTEKDLPTGVHNMFVRNSRGTSNIVTVTVTNPTTPTITSITPSSGAVGATVTITGTGFLPNLNRVYIGQGETRVITSSVASTNGGTKITYKIPQPVKACQNLKANQGCSQKFTGTYPIVVETNSGFSNPVNFTITK